MLINIKTRYFHSSVKQEEHLFHRTLYHWLLSSYEYCKVFKNSFFIEHLRLEMFFEKGVLKSFPNFTGKRLCWSLFLKSLQSEDLQLYLEKSPAQMFPVKFAKFLRTHFFTENLRWLLLHFFF